MYAAQRASQRGTSKQCTLRMNSIRRHCPDGDTVIFGVFLSFFLCLDVLTFYLLNSPSSRARTDRRPNAAALQASKSADPANCDLRSSSDFASLRRLAAALASPLAYERVQKCSIFAISCSRFSLQCVCVCVSVCVVCFRTEFGRPSFALHLNRAIRLAGR